MRSSGGRLPAVAGSASRRFLVSLGVVALAVGLAMPAAAAAKSAAPAKSAKAAVAAAPRDLGPPGACQGNPRDYVPYADVPNQIKAVWPLVCIRRSVQHIATPADIPRVLYIGQMSCLAWAVAKPTGVWGAPLSLAAAAVFCGGSRGWSYVKLV